MENPTNLTFQEARMIEDKVKDALSRVYLPAPSRIKDYELKYRWAKKLLSVSDLELFCLVGEYINTLPDDLPFAVWEEKIHNFLLYVE